MIPFQKGDCPQVLFDEFSGHCQAETRSSLSFGRKEGLEDPDWGVRRVVAHAIADIRKYAEMATAGLSSLPRGELGYDLVDDAANLLVA